MKYKLETLTLILQLILLYNVDCEVNVHRYCIIGAGPSGLQMGSFLQRRKRNYVVFEKSSIAGSFFKLMPRHDILISSNKRFTGSRNTEFNLRHDWNSLLSENLSLRFTKYSELYFPKRKEMLKYLKDFHIYENINVLFNTLVQNITKNNVNGLFYMNDQNGEMYICKFLIIGTGMEVPHNTIIKGSEHAYGYEYMNVTSSLYRDKNIAIIGSGNAAFEVAKSIESETQSTVIFSRGPLRMAYSTHYVGDLRAINFNILDSYQFSMLTGVVDISGGITEIQKVHDKLFLPEAKNRQTNKAPLYDKVIRCTGWQFNSTILRNLYKVDENKSSKYPNMLNNYMSSIIHQLYFIGAITHNIDYRESSGGFIHGFRYTVRALHRILEWKNEGNKWSKKLFHINFLMNYILQRINEASGIYQMFLTLGDIYVFDRLMERFYVIEEYPILDISNIEGNTGLRVDNGFVILRFEYNINYSGIGKHTPSANRVKGKPTSADSSKFLHPVLHYYKEKFKEGNFFHLKYLPKAASVHHMVEDLKTKFHNFKSKVIPLLLYLEQQFKIQLLDSDDYHCMYYSLTMQENMFMCR